jgi:hypothetical protein
MEKKAFRFALNVVMNGFVLLELSKVYKEIVLFTLNQNT